jgi:hypothetical protein
MTDIKRRRIIAPAKRIALACMEVLDTNHEARRLYELYGGFSTGNCELCGVLAPLDTLTDPRAVDTGKTVEACAWGCDFPCHGYPCDGCPACCPGLRNLEFWMRASANPLAWWV